MTKRTTTVQDAMADLRMMLRQSQQPKTLEQATAEAKAMGRQYGVLCRNGQYIIYNCTTSW